jgi:hypothetical protein
MSTNHYNLGYEFFQEKKNEVLSNEQLKQMHPLFRRGYRTAQEDFMKRNNRSFPITLANIPTRGETFVPSWNDILAATRRPRFQKLHAPHMAPVLNMLIKSVEDNSSDIKRYADVVRKVDEGFDIILQYGYDCGILDSNDLSKYNYIAK